MWIKQNYYKQDNDQDSELGGRSELYSVKEARILKSSLYMVAFI
jgi:hypothetical protein